MITDHPYEVAEGASGNVCTAMVLNQGHGDQCGAGPMEHYQRSINAENSVWPVRQRSILLGHGHIVYLPRTYILGVLTNSRPGGWGITILHSPKDSAYPRGGYDIFVGDDELDRAVVIDEADIGELVALAYHDAIENQENHDQTT